MANSIPIVPRAKYVVAQERANSNRTGSGLYLPSDTTRGSYYTVVAIGKNIKTLEVGDTVLVRDTTEVVSVTVGSNKYQIIDNKNIIATIKE